MKVTCSRCGTEYNFDDSKVTEEGVKVKCTRCDNVFRVRKKAYAITEPAQTGEAGGQVVATPTEDTSAPTFTGATLRQWMIRRETGETMEFKEMTTLQRWIVERRVAPADEISHNGVKWKRLGAIPELAPFFKVVEDEDAAEAEARKPRDARTSTGEFLKAQVDDDERTQPRVGVNAGVQDERAKRASLSVDAASGVNGDKPATPRALDGWAEERPTSRSDAAIDRAGDAERARAEERDRRDAERPTHDPSVSERERSVERPAPPRRGSRAVMVLGGIAVLGGAFYWAQFTEGGLTVTAPARAYLLAMLGAAPAATATPEATPTAVAAVSPTPEPTPVAAASPVETVATPEPTPTEVAPTTPLATATPAPTKVARLSVDKLLQQGFEAYSRGRYREAINKYQAAVNADSDNSEAYALLGLAYLDSGNDDLAESSLEAAIRLNPRFADAHRYLGMLYSRRGDKARAVSSFTTYLELRPNGPTSDDVRRRVASLQGG